MANWVIKLSSTLFAVQLVSYRKLPSSDTYTHLLITVTRIRILQALWIVLMRMGSDSPDQVQICEIR